MRGGLGSLRETVCVLHLRARHRHKGRVGQRTIQCLCEREKTGRVDRVSVGVRCVGGKAACADQWGLPPLGIDEDDLRGLGDLLGHHDVELRRGDDRDSIQGPLAEEIGHATAGAVVATRPVAYADDERVSHGESVPFCAESRGYTDRYG